MLLLLTGDIQIGKTSWLLKTVARLEEGGVSVEGVVAPGVWVPVRAGEPGYEGASAGLGAPAPADGPACRYDKRGIDNLLLPDHETVPFARREDLARAEGTYDASNQAAQVGMTWHIDDRAVARVNAHFDRLAAAADEAAGCAGAPHRPRVLIVDELGRLELLHDGGLTSAMALLAQGPRGYYDHAVVVARDLFGLSERVEQLFTEAWGGSVRIPHDEQTWQRWFAPLCAGAR